MRVIWAALALGAAQMASADCLTAPSIVQGVSFTRSDGRQGFAQRQGDDVVIDYATGTGPWQDQRRTWLGFYEVQTDQYFQDDPDAVGGGTKHVTQAFNGQMPAPAAGANWSMTMEYHEVQDNSSEVGHIDYDARYQVAFHALAEIGGTISGCPYRAIPVEATFRGPDDSFTRRWLYFTDLGFALETKRDGKTLKIKTMVAAH